MLAAICQEAASFGQRSAYLTVRSDFAHSVNAEAFREKE